GLSMQSSGSYGCAPEGMSPSDRPIIDDSLWRHTHMIRKIAWTALFLSTSGFLAQSPAPSPKVQRPSFNAFEVATIKPVAPDDPARLISPVYPQHILLPARNTTMGEFASLLQRAVLDRPVVDQTGLQGRYDFDLQWAPDETQFGGEVPVAPSDAPAASLFSAIQDQLGLRLIATRGPVNALVVDKAERPSAD